MSIELACESCGSLSNVKYQAYGEHMFPLCPVCAGRISTIDTVQVIPVTGGYMVTHNGSVGGSIVTVPDRLNADQIACNVKLAMLASARHETLQLKRSVHK